jgi:hypothetical protein
LALCSSEQITTPQQIAAIQLYRHKVLFQAGAPTDPLEIMLIEQFVMAQQKIGDLHVRAANASEPEAVGQYLTAATRLMAECRKTLLALKTYRAPSSSPQLTFVNQQNLAAGEQRVAYVDNSGNPAAAQNKNSDSQLGSKQQEALPQEPYPEIIAQSESGRGRAPKPLEARRINRRRSRKAEAGRATQPALVELNGAEDTCR